MTHSYKPNNASLTVPNGGYAHANVTMASTTGTGVPRATGAGTNLWTTAVTQPFYTTKAKVNINDQDLIIDGLSLRDFMASVNERLAVMVPNPELEAEFDALKACADRYRELEQKFLEQKRVWETLKKQD
jgi:hypothetical protein